MVTDLTFTDTNGATVRLGDKIRYGDTLARVIERNGELQAQSGNGAVPLSVLKERDGGFVKVGDE